LLSARKAAAPTTLEITGPAISKFNPYAGPGVIVNGAEKTTGFIVNWSEATVAAPPENLQRYDVSFYAGYPENGLAYVVKYVFDPLNSLGYVYLNSAGSFPHREQPPRRVAPSKFLSNLSVAGESPSV
jgi:hypothetical protein